MEESCDQVGGFIFVMDKCFSAGTGYPDYSIFLFSVPPTLFSCPEDNIISSEDSPTDLKSQELKGLGHTCVFQS